MGHVIKCSIPYVFKHKYIICLIKICTLYLDRSYVAFSINNSKATSKFSSSVYAVNFKSSLDYNLRIWAKMLILLCLPNAMTLVILWGLAMEGKIYSLIHSILIC